MADSYASTPDRTSGQMTILWYAGLEIMKNHTVNATEFKAKCLAYLKEIEQHGEPITITRRGRPVAVLGPTKKTAWKSPRNSWAGKMRIVGDIVNVDMSNLWEVVEKDQG